jgi:DNA segregation ATPase FtsK/SpoIIIE, S-DNA-T family
VPAARASKPPKIGNQPAINALAHGGLGYVRGIGQGFVPLVKSWRVMFAATTVTPYVLLVGEQGTKLTLIGLGVATGGVAASPLRGNLHSGIAATFKRYVLTRQWDTRMRACKLEINDRTPVAKQVQQQPWGERVRVVLPPGIAPEDVRKRTAQLAWTFGKRPACRVATEESRVWLEFSDGRQLRETIPAPPIPEVTDLEALRIGRREDGSPWTLRVLDPERGYRHLFVAGATGAGKSGIFWQAIRELAPGVRDGLVQLHVADPKFGVEFDKVQPLCERYAETEKDIAVMLRDARKFLVARSEEMKAQGIRQHVPRPGSPALAVFVDEFPSLLRDCEDSKLAKQMEQDARVLLRLGRVFGVFLWVATQDPRVESFPLRSFFVDEIGLRVRQPNHVDMIYGRGAREAGATLDLIPKDMPGTGFEVTEDGCSMVRAYHVTGELIDAVVSGYAPRSRADREALVAKFDVGERPRSTP